MAETETTPAGCSNPGCNQPGTNKCSACKTTPYCGPICQTAHWPHHKEECEGHLLKIGNAHQAKALGFWLANNSVQALRYSDLALVKFNAMKKRPLESVSEGLSIKCTVLQELDRNVEFLQCAKDKYNLWALARGPAHPKTIDAAFFLINALSLNKEDEDAYFFAHTLWEIIHTNNHVDNDIPGEQRQDYVAIAAEMLAKATYQWAESGGIPPEEKQKAGEEAIALARESLEIRIQLYGTENKLAAAAMGSLAQVLDYFSDNGDDEALSLYQQSIAIQSRVSGSASVNLSGNEFNFGNAYFRRAEKALDANDLEQYAANLELALPHYHEAGRIARAINHNDIADSALRMIADVEERLRKIGIGRAAATAAAPVRG